MRAAETAVERSQEYLPSLTYVPVAPFRERFVLLESRGVLTRGAVARALGWVRKAPAKDRLRGRSGLDTGRVSRTSA